MSIRIFISFQHEDRELASQFKWNLERFGFSVFLAHEDIQPSADWPETILNELKGVDVFLPLLTPRFRDSYWTNQEIGIAIARDVLIIPLKAEDVNPYGLFYELQALSVNVNDIRGDCARIVEVIADCDHLKDKLRLTLIEGFGDSISFQDATSKSQYLLDHSPYSELEINVILRMAGQNDNIYGSYGARDNIRELIRTHREKANPKLLTRYNQKVEMWNGIRSGMD